MHKSSDLPGPAELPLTIRILPGRSRIWAGFGGGLALASIALWLALDADGRPSAALTWIALAVLAWTAIGPGLRLLLQLPLIEASELGIAIWIHGPYRRPFFVPWKRVHAIVLTQVRGARAAAGTSGRDALGIQLDSDARLPLPPMPARAETPVPGAERADLAWSNGSISGDPRRWVALLERMKAACAETAGPGQT